MTELVCDLLLHTLDPPSSPVVTLSQPDNSCSTVLTWSPPASDIPITSYSVFRDNINIATVSSTTTQYTDSDVTTVFMLFLLCRLLVVGPVLK